MKGIGTDAVVASFRPDLSRLRFSTYFGGNGDEQIGGLALGSDDSITIVGTTYSTDLAQRYGSGSDVLKGATDVFVARLSADGSSKLGFRLIGGSSSESVTGAALDAAGNLVFGGNTLSVDYPVTPNSPFSKKPSSNDYSQFLTVLGPDLSLRFSTYLGGNGRDTFQGPNLLPDGRIWLTGTTMSTDLPVSSTAISGSPLGLEDVYVMLLDWRR